MTDLERFVRHLSAAAATAGATGRPIQLDHLMGRLMPYRACRSALALDSVEDYEWLLLQLGAGERGFARTDPPEAAEAFRNEASGSNPDLSILRLYPEATLQLDVARLSRSNPLGEYAPAGGGQAGTGGSGDDGRVQAASEPAEPAPEPEAAAAPVAPVEPIEPPAESPPAEAAPGCIACGQSLPEGRTANFCPHCGVPQRAANCPACGSEFEPQWHYCVTCGHRIRG